MKKPIITFNNFSFQYHSQSEPTLKGIQLTIYEGEKVLIVDLVVVVNQHWRNVSTG